MTTAGDATWNQFTGNSSVTFTAYTKHQIVVSMAAAGTDTGNRSLVNTVCAKSYVDLLGVYMRLNRPSRSLAKDKVVLITFCLP